MPVNKDITGCREFNFSAVLRGTVIALVISILGAALLGIIFYFFNLSERYLWLVTMVVLFFSVFSGGVFAAQKAGNRGIFHGLAVGLIIFILSWLLGVLFFSGHTILSNMVQKLVITGLAGGLGGILGVGLSS